ncbi:MAG TPA: alkaline phosphatase family protein [Tepidisphaeraceae bacterium]|jgi:arylsulfatase A-like enzyme
MKQFVFVLFLLFIHVACLAQTTKPIPQIDHVIIISIDGLRPDVLLRANAPNIRNMMAQGCFTMWARTTAVALTLPSHVSMLTGVIPVKHGIHWNEDLPLARPYYPKVPTLFELARKRGLTTAMVAAKSKFDVFEKPGALNWYFAPPVPSLPAANLPMEKQSTKDTTTPDHQIADLSIQFLKAHQPNVLFIHFASTDVIGHKETGGWGTPEQVNDVGEIDGNIGRILQAVKQLGLQNHTAIILSSDHGGAGHTHGADDERSRHIPWIIDAPGIRTNYDLTRLPELTVNTYDTFATACWLLGIHAPAGIDGKPIIEILPAKSRELLK